MKTAACITSLLLLLLSPLSSFADISMFVSPDGDDGFIVEGDNAAGVAALDITIGYDTAALANPRVETQGGTVASLSTDSPGILAVSIDRENPDSSFELHLNFDRTGASAGGITSVSAIARHTDGRRYEASSDTRAIPAPNITEHKGRAAAQDTEETGASPATIKKGKRKDADADEAMTALERMMLETPKSMLQRFREFKGEKGLKTFTLLFDRDRGDIVAQEPAIALSDGKTPLTMRIQLPATGMDTPNVALTDAELVSLRKEGDNFWEIIALPTAGVWEATLTLAMGGAAVEYPLVVAPPVRLPEGIDAKSFLPALERYVAGQAAGNKGAIDRPRQEYIFTANYLARAKQ
jgi:hypothetical protein